MNAILTKTDAYKAMTAFLTTSFKKANSSDEGGLLSSLLLLEDDSTADRASWNDWTRAVNKITTTRIVNELTYKDAFESMRAFLEAYQDRGRSDDVASVLVAIQISSKGELVNPSIWEEWLQCIDDVNAGKGDFYLRFI